MSPRAWCLVAALAGGCGGVECDKDFMRDRPPPRSYVPGPSTSAEADYRFTVATDEVTFVETFTRDGKRYEITYRAKP